MYEWLDEKYILLASSRLSKFKRRGKTFNFRCPYCGDSSTNKTKARGYLFNRGKGYRFYCHNCQQSATFANFLQSIDQTLFTEYWKERIVAREQNPALPAVEEKFAPPKFYNETPLKLLKKISQLPVEHGARKFVESRMLPTTVHWKLYYCSKYQHWVNTFLPGKYPNPKVDPRLVIPVFDRNGNFIGCQGRRLVGDGPKYITIVVDSNGPIIYNQDAIDYTKTIYVVEGPLDSLFLPNAIAAMSSSLHRELPRLGARKDQFVLIYDNEPRNKEVMAQAHKAASSGWKIVVWPDNCPHKDINEMIKGGMTADQVKTMIDENTYSGLEAVARLSHWRMH